jgi:hypothetical protein
MRSRLGDQRGHVADIQPSVYHTAQLFHSFEQRPNVVVANVLRKN